ncbi:MAG: S8 family peptidase [Pseudomonadota bacterium]
MIKHERLGAILTSRLAQQLAIATIAPLALSLSAFAQSTTGVSADQAEGLTNQIIVKYRDGVANRMSPLGRAMGSGTKADRARVIASLSGLDVTYRRDVATGGEVYRLAKWRRPGELKRLLGAVAADTNVEYVEPDVLLQPQMIPNDPSYNQQWHYFEAVGGFNLPTAWDTTTGAGAVVSVIDTGYLPHPDLLPNLLPGYDFIGDTFVSVDGDGRDADATDPGDASEAGVCRPWIGRRDSSWHGTHVAGTVAAVTNNATGVAGVAFDAKVVPVRVLGRCGGYTSDIADGVLWSAGGTVAGVPANANPADVLNMSLGGPGSCTSTMQNAIDTARTIGATIVVAAGNDAINASGATPANCSGVIVVASTDRTGSRSYFSNFGAVVDVAAPGGDVRFTAADGVLSTSNSGLNGPVTDNYRSYQGTSMAAPHVAGLAAMLISADSSLSPDAVESIIESTARAFPGVCSECGAGIADAAAAVASLGNGGPAALENGVPVTGLSGNTNDELYFTLQVPAGASSLEFKISGGSGDADLYVRYASPPTQSAYDCRPYLIGNEETCSFASPQTGTYHVMVRAYASFSNVTLVANYSTGGSYNLTNIAANAPDWVRDTFTVPAGMTTLDVTMSGGTGDADLYLRYGSAPDLFTYDCRPYRWGNNEVCTITNPAAGTWHIGVQAYSSYSGVNVSGSWN